MKVIIALFSLLALGCLAFTAPAPFPKPVLGKHLHGTWNIKWGEVYKGMVSFKSDGTYSYWMKAGEEADAQFIQAAGTYKFDNWNLKLREQDMDVVQNYTFKKKYISRKQMVWTLEGSEDSEITITNPTKK